MFCLRAIREEARQMKNDPRGQVELRDVTAGLWIWRVEHPGWKPNQGWEPLVASTCVESGGEMLVLDPLAPPDDAAEVWGRASPPLWSCSSQTTFGTSISSCTAMALARSAPTAS